jgi:hypothetical protein
MCESKEGRESLEGKGGGGVVHPKAGNCTTTELKIIRTTRFREKLILQPTPESDNVDTFHH